MKQVTSRLISILAFSAILNVFFILNASAADIDKLAEDCSDCHDKDGASKDDDVPIIGGMSKQYLLDSMAAYVAKDRPCPEYEYEKGANKGKKTTMCKVADDLSKDDTEALAKHYAGKPFVRAKQTFDAALAEKGKAVHEDLCEKCHAEGGSKASDDAGILAGQWMPYLEVTFNDYAKDDREQPKKMKKKMKKLDEETTKQLIHYYGSFK